MKLGRIILSLVLIKSGLFFALPINAEENRNTLDSLWGSVKSESKNLLNKSLDITSDFANELGKVIDGEIANLKELQVEPTQIDVRDKIDTVRI